MSKHTPAPWDAKIRRGPFYFPSVLIGPPDTSGSRASITINDGRSPEMIADGNRPGGTTRETVEANARLMAASIEMLAILELLPDAEDDPQLLHELIKKAREITARIEGEQS